MKNKDSKPIPAGPELIRETARGIYQLQIPLSDSSLTFLDHMNAYLIKGTRGWLLIDTGWNAPDSQQALDSVFKNLNLTYTDIRTLVITHCHPDHFGMAGRIKQFSPKTEILMHRWESDLIESRYIKFSEPQKKMAILLENHGVPDSLLEALGSASMPALEFVTITLPDHFLYGGEIIQTGIYDLEVIWTPGHSPGHICLYESKNQLLFAGDHILPTISPNISYHILSGDNPLGDYINALAKLVNIPVRGVHPGHQQSFTDLKGRINEIYEHHQQREAEILKVIGRELSSSFEISSHLSWNLPGIKWEQFPPLQQRFALTETIAHLERMRWEGKIEKIIKDSHIYYRSI